MEYSKKLILIILDGWGHGDKSKSDAIYNARTPFVDSLYEKYPHSELITSGEAVGLPEGQMGNSEVGHTNLGAGRVVYQDLVKINKDIESGAFFKQQELINAFSYAKENNKPVHLMGLVSDGGIHSHIRHLFALCDMANDVGLEDVFIHAFTDGRDTDPKSGIGFINQIKEHLRTSSGKLATVVGRYYAMDRDKRWERIKEAYDMLCMGKGIPSMDLLEAIEQSYDSGVTDEFIKPIVRVDDYNQPIATIDDGDVVICFNFRTDRCRQITMALTQQSFPEQDMEPLDLYYVTMTEYDDTFKNVKVVYRDENIKSTLGEILANSGKKQIRIAETEKYPHVTYFFSGGREKPFEGENRIMIPSPKVATYDLQPSMSAEEVTDAIVKELKEKSADFICLNFANPDMVGHTGVYEAIIEAVETVDSCTKKVTEAARENGYSVIILADHGNADNAINSNGTPNTNHSTNPVPCILLDDDIKAIRNGKLGDIAPTILKLMGVDIPKEMTGIVLV